MYSLDERTIVVKDDNIDALRERFPNGLHFVVGDVHGDVGTLQKLMEKIRFNPALDHVFFVGDYNSGGDVTALLCYMSEYYQADYETPGFHMIRGNHERELFPVYTLENLPDILVVRGKKLNFYIVHAGMVSSAFDLINEDLDSDPDRKVYAYQLEDDTCSFNAPLRQLVWSMRGLYSQRSRWRVWPDEARLAAHNACIIHGHTPYCFLKKPDRFTYGYDNLFWENQHIWFSAELHSFNIDSNIKGRYENGEGYRGLSCLCMEVYDELAAARDGQLTTALLREAENGVFGVKADYWRKTQTHKSPDRILNAAPQMKVIGLEKGVPVIRKARECE